MAFFLKGRIILPRSIETLTPLGMRLRNEKIMKRGKFTFNDVNSARRGITMWHDFT